MTPQRRKTYGGWEDGESARSTAGCVGPALWEASSDSEGIHGLSCEMDKLDSRSVSNEEFVLDVYLFQLKRLPLL